MKGSAENRETFFNHKGHEGSRRRVNSTLPSSSRCSELESPERTKCVRPYTELFHEVFFFEDAAVVEFVAGDHVGEGADAYLIVAGDAAAEPGLVVEIA